MKHLIFISFFLCFLVVTPNEKSNPPKKFVVVLDAGHGGHDPGNRGNGLFEKDIALDIILKTGALLSKDPNIKVVYTRKTDVFIDLFVRGDIANKAKADLFVSVHCNAHNSQAFGTETFVLGLHANERNFNVAKKENSVILLEDNYEKNYDGFDPNSQESVVALTITQEEYLEQSLSLASFVQNNFSKQLKRKNRGVKQAGFIVLHKTFMPSVLIETGFLTNNREGKYLNSNKGKQQMANAISKAVLDYKRGVQESFAIEKPVVIKPETIEKIKKKKTEEKKEIVSTIKKVSTVQKVDKPDPGTQKAIGLEKKEKQKTILQTSKETPQKKNIKSNQIIFRVQLAASLKPLENTSKNFKELQNNIEMLRIDQYHKYYFGKTTNYNNAKELRKEAIKNGFSTCFIVAFQNDKPIKLYEALKLKK